MRAAVHALVLMTCMAAVAAAQTPAPKGTKAIPAPGRNTDRASTEKALIANEEKLNDAVMKGDVATFQQWAAADAWSVGDMGATSRADFVKMMKPGMASITDSKSDDFKFVWASPDVAVLTYTWTGKGTFMGMPVHSPTFSTTVWAQRNGKWVAVFHQETSKAPPPPAAPMAPKAPVPPNPKK